MTAQTDEADGTDNPPPGPAAVGLAGRHRRHQFPGRSHVVKVLYGEQERTVVQEAARLAGMRPSGYVAAAALVMARRANEAAGAGLDVAQAPGQALLTAGALSDEEGREVLAELMQARLAVRRFGGNVNQAAAVLNSGGQAPVWLQQAVAGGERAVARLDAAAALIAARLA